MSRRSLSLAVALAVLVLSSFGTVESRERKQPLRAAAASCERNPLAKVEIKLSKTDGRCKAEAKPERACVSRGGVLRWKVDNGCGALEGRGKPALAIAKLVDRKTGLPAEWLSRSCTASLDSVAPGLPEKGNVIHCDVPEDAPLGLFKYSIEGEIEPLDPEIEVLEPVNP